MLGRRRCISLPQAHLVDVLMFSLSRSLQWLLRFRPSSLASLAYYSIAPALIILLYLLLPYSHEIGVVLLPQPPNDNSVFDNYLDLLDKNSSGYHPIDELILDAGRKHDLLLLQRSTKLKDAAAKYRIRHGRHPPPGFDKWVDYALKHDAVIIEQFFDRIQQDIQPFWAQDAKATAAQAATWEHMVRVRDGKAYGVGGVEGRVPWLKLWTSLVAEAAEWLPDVDMPINYMDEPRILVRWEEINRLVEKAELSRTITLPQETIQTFEGLADIDTWSGDVRDPEWITTGAPQFWDLARAACAPDSPSRDVPALQDFSAPPVFPPDWNSFYSENGFVKNFTAATDPCLQPYLRGLHGTFVEQVTIATSQSLMPIFSGCKMPVNNDILIPGAMYLTDDSLYSGGSNHGPPWHQKQDGIIWRGVASGGRHKDVNWSHFQRLRLIQMLNGTTVSNLEHNGTGAPTFEVPPTPYSTTIDAGRHIGEWISNISDVGFTDLLCFPRDGDCSYLAPYFTPTERIPMQEQFQQKFIPDVDGNTFSARFRSLLLSTSLPLKTTIYAEWHDDRLLPWLHFAPLDNTLQDIYSVLDYFTKDEKGDRAAQHMAESGKAWSERVLRREDMLLYVWRLLLEFARVCDPNRDRLGFVDVGSQTNFV